MSTIELELSEEEKAALITSLATGISESTITNSSSTRHTLHEKQQKSFNGPPIPANRDGMGAFVPGPGQQPLSHRDLPCPGPADYSPEFTAVVKKYPEYSLGESIDPATKRQKRPAPNRYNTSKDFVWGRCKKITVKERLPTRLHVFPPAKDTGPGPAAYKRTSLTAGPSYSMRTRPSNPAVTGLVSALAERPDPTVPGPSFRPDDEEWLQKPQTFGMAREDRKNKQKWPGPASYKPNISSSAPKWAIGMPEKKIRPAVVPGPADYVSPALVPGGRQPTIGLKLEPPKIKQITPAPNSYSQQGFSLEEPGYTMKYRWFDRTLEEAPGPGTYTCKYPSAKCSPGFTIAATWRPVPSNGVPGPTRYNVKAPPMDKGRTIGHKPKAPESETPGPAKYSAETLYVSSQFKNSPSYSLSGRRVSGHGDDEAPGPSDYFVKEVKVVKPGKTIGVRYKSKDHSTGPGPAQMTCRPLVRTSGPCAGCECNRGATMKGRHTPNKYLGLAKLVKLSLPLKGVPPAPLIG